MGYCIDVHGELTIKEEKIPLAIDCLKELMKGARLSWVHTEKVVERLEANDLLGALRELRYSFVEIQTNVEFDYFLGEKWGGDGILWETLAPAVDNGSVMEYRGEDGHRWRFLFEDGSVKEQNAVITWE